MNANDARHLSGLPGLLRWALGLVMLAALAAGLQACGNAQAAPESTFVLLDGSKKNHGRLQGQGHAGEFLGDQLRDLRR